MKMFLFTVVAAVSTVAFAQQDTAGCDLTTKPGVAICKMHNCQIGEATVATCEVRFKVRPGSAGVPALPTCQGDTSEPCENRVNVKSRQATTPEQQEAFEKAQQKEADQYNKAGG